MKMISRPGFLAISLAFVALTPSRAYAGAAYDELSDAQKAAVQNGEQVFIAEDQAGLPWPKVRIYQRVNATAEEAMAVLADYELQPQYVPNVKTAHTVARPDAATAVTDYAIRVSLLLTEHITLSCKLSRAGDLYSQDVHLVKGQLTKSSESLIRTETLGTGSLLAYRTLVVPGSVLAGLAKPMAIQQVKDTVQAIVAQIQREKASQPQLLDQQLQALRAAVAAH